MQFITSLVAVAAVASSVVSADLIKYDDNYVASFTTNQGPCSDGSNGLGALFATLGNIPNYPFVGSYSAVSAYNSPMCGQCFQITATATGATIYATATDGRTDPGWDLSREAFDVLGGAAGYAAGSVDATVTQVDRTLCGFA